MWVVQKGRVASDNCKQHGQNKTGNHAQRGKCHYRQRVAEAEKRAQLAAEEIKANAQAEAARIIAQAKADAEQQVGKARDELRHQVASLAVRGAEQILRREVDPKAQAALLDQLKAEL